MATVNPTTAIQKKVDVSIKDGKTFSEEVFFLQIWSTGNVTSEKQIKVTDGEGFRGAFRQIQFKFDKNHNYIYTKNDNNQKIDENTKVLLQNFLYQDYQQATLIQLSERVKLAVQMMCLRSIMVQQSL